MFDIPFYSTKFENLNLLNYNEYSEYMRYRNIYCKVLFFYAIIA